MFCGCMIIQSIHEGHMGHPQWKFSSTALRMQQCDQNTQLNNLRFLHELPYIMYITTGVVHDIHSFLLNSNQSDPEGVPVPKQKKVGLALYMYM